MLKRLIKDALMYSSVFMFAVYVTKEIIDFFEKDTTAGINSRVSKIEDFSLYSFGKQSYSLKGKSITDMGNKIYIYKPYLEFYTEDGLSRISSRDAFYYPKRSYLSLMGDVNIESKDGLLTTSYLNVMIDRYIAYNNTDNILVSDRFKIEGKNLVYRIKDRTLILEKIKTEVYFSDG